MPAFDEEQKRGVLQKTSEHYQKLKPFVHAFHRYKRPSLSADWLASEAAFEKTLESGHDPDFDVIAKHMRQELDVVGQFLEHFVTLACLPVWQNYIRSLPPGERCTGVAGLSFATLYTGTAAGVLPSIDGARQEALFNQVRSTYAPFVRQRDVPGWAVDPDFFNHCWQQIESDVDPDACHPAIVSESLFNQVMVSCMAIASLIVDKQS